MEDIAQFLHDMEWIYDFHVTKIFTKDIFSQMPEDWKASLLNLPVHTLNGIPQGKTQDDWPLSLRLFLEKCQKFSLQNLARASCENDPVADTRKVPQTFTKGLSEKKTHEVLCLLKLTERIANVTGSKYVLDIGSGLGYIDSLLHNTLKLTVVGAESQKDRVKSATERQTRLFSECSGVRHIHWALTDDEETLTRAHREVVEMMKADVICTCKEEKKRNQETLRKFAVFNASQLFDRSFSGVSSCGRKFLSGEISNTDWPSCLCRPLSHNAEGVPRLPSALIINSAFMLLPQNDS